MCPNFRFGRSRGCAGTSATPRPDLCLYKGNEAGKIAEDTSVLGYAELFVQFRAVETVEDPFEDPVSNKQTSDFDFIRDVYEEIEEKEEYEKKNSLSCYGWIRVKNNKSVEIVSCWAIGIINITKSLLKHIQASIVGHEI